MNSIETKAFVWLTRNSKGLENYLAYNNKQDIRPILEDPAGCVNWLFEHRYSLSYFLVGRDGPYSDGLRDLKDILQIISRGKPGP